MNPALQYKKYITVIPVLVPPPEFKKLRGGTKMGIIYKNILGKKEREKGEKEPKRKEKRN